MPDGRLWLLRDVYAAETAWAPRHVGKELRLSRLGAFDAGLGAIRADAETAAARKAGDRDRAGRHETLAGSYRKNFTSTHPPYDHRPRPAPKQPPTALRSGLSATAVPPQALGALCFQHQEHRGMEEQ